MNNNTVWPNSKFSCPHCHAICAFGCVFSAVGVFEDQYYPISVWRCHNCDRAIFLTHEKTYYLASATKNFEPFLVSPAMQPRVDSRVPEGVAKDFVEAAKDFNMGSYKSSAVMARRTIQKMCLNLGATKTKKLWEQIRELKENGKLHSDLAEIATEIRFLGNSGAHPEDDGLDGIDSDDAKEILEFTGELLDDLYVRPEKVAAMKKKREAKAGPV